MLVVSAVGCHDAPPPAIHADTSCNPATGVALAESAHAVLATGDSHLATGPLGCLGAGARERAAVAFAVDLVPDVIADRGSFAPVADARADADSLGLVHVRLQQHIDGLPVAGAQLVIHARAATDEVYAVSGRIARRAATAANPEKPPLSADDALARAIAALRESAARVGHPLAEVTLADTPSLEYAIADDGLAYLAWTAHAAYHGADGPELDRLYADAATGALIARHPRIHRGRFREIFDADHGYSLPGTLALAEIGEPSKTSDASVQAAFDHVGTTYDYYFERLGRDSFDDAGAPMVATVHYGTHYNNAFWNGAQMVFGDGDGEVFAPLAQALDVVAHEFTHGVTERTAGLIYQGESGALNEAMSDIFAAAISADAPAGADSNPWQLGEDVFTPGIPGDALRYMNDPAADSSSRDYYPDRYTGTSDNGGVHFNSGIANLAFYLLAEGGTHPRGKSDVAVTGIGVHDAAAVFYRALTYLTSMSDFESARHATAQAAADQFGADSDQVADVHRAWDAVGVPGGAADPPAITDLEPGARLDDLQGDQGSWRLFRVNVPEGQESFIVSTSGGAGDVDLYLRRGAAPDQDHWTCRPYRNGNTERCRIRNPEPGAWFIGLHGYEPYAGATLIVTLIAAPVALESGQPVTDLAGDEASWQYFAIDVPANQQFLSVRIAGGTGDADLYVRRGGKPSTARWDCRPYQWGNDEVCQIARPRQGTWFIGIHAWEAYQGLTLSAEHGR